MAKKSVEVVLKMPVLPSEIKINTPENWCWARLIQLYNFIDYRGKTPNKIETGVPLVTAKNIRMGYLDYTIADFISREEYEQRQSRGISRRGDILFTTEAPMGNVAIADLDEYSAGQRVITFQKRPEIEWVSNQFYFYYIMSCYFQDELQHNKTGNTVEGIKAEKLMRFPVPVPPHAEQQRIVDRIEYLFAKLDEAKEKAQSVLDSFETRKAAILHKAFTGELTATWREQNTTDDKHLQKLSTSDYISYEETPCELPPNWQWIHMGAIGYTNIGLTYKPTDKSPDGTIVLRSSNIQAGQMDYDDIVRVKMDIPASKMCQTGDLLICARNGSKALVGKTAIVDKDGMSFGAFMAIFRSKYNPFIYYFLNSSFFRNLIDKDVGTSTINQVTQAIIKELAFPFAPEKEQEEIVRILDSLFAKEQQAKEAAEAVLEKIDLLKKSILARAFRGELGTNDPTEESALELLKTVL